jgi:hypothetical protein
MTFNEAIIILEKHESIDSIKYKSKALGEQADLKGSWGDPMFKIAAKKNIYVLIKVTKMEQSVVIICGLMKMISSY